MPNPITMVQRAVSKPVIVKPQPIAPIPEGQYRDENIPYRGIQNHGVAFDGEDYPDYTDEQGRPVVVYELPEEGAPPIPVRIVQGESRREFRRFRTNRLTVSATGAQSATTQLVGRDPSRQMVTIVNTSTDKTIYVAPIAEELAIGGYPVGPGKEFTSLSEDAVWATSVDSTPVVVGIKWEYTVSE